MTYATGGLIQATDYNAFAASVNAIWGTGSGDAGYGQTSTLSTVAASNTVTAAQWSTLIDRLDYIRRHQSNVTSGLTAPTAGTVITFLSTLSSVISTATTSRLSVASYGTAITGALSNATAWTTTRQLEQSITFSSADSMRYFFNAGGYVQFTGVGSVLTANSKSVEWDTLLGNGSNAGCGYVRIFAQSSDRVLGGGTTNVYNTNLGFYDLTTTGQIILRQYSTNTLGGYNLNYATFSARLNASPGSATVLYLNMTLTDAAADGIDDTVTGTITMDTSVVPPWTSWISNTWSTPTIADTITG